MVKPLEYKKRQRALIGVLATVVIVLVFLWYFGFQKKPSVREGQPITGLIPTQEVKLDLGILDDSLFKSLKSHGLLPVIVGETGRDNPFEPY